MIKKNLKKIVAILLTLCMALPIITSCGLFGKNIEGTLVVASQEFNSIFNPVFARTHYDVIVADKINIAIYKYDRKADLESYACEYKAPEEFKADNGETWVKYTFTLKDGIKFSDGKAVTADDIIFTYKLYLDPTYDGGATLFNLPILGLKPYLYDDPDYTAIEKQFNEEADAKINDEEYMLQWLFDTYGEEGETKEDYLPYVTDEEEKGNARNELMQQLMGDYIKNKLSGGEAAVADIEGIKKIDSKTVEVTLTELSPKAEADLAISILPKHYYGKNFKKGDLTSVKDLNKKPLGAGPYIFDSFENNVVSLNANKNYFEGTPKIGRLVYQVVEPDNLYDVVKLKEVDISDPKASTDNISNSEKDGLHYELIDNLGYGYIGVSAKAVPDKNIRKGLMSLMNRAPAVEAAYPGGLAQLIERPISMVSWAYPTGATAYYEYSTDKALQYFNAAGYVQEDGKLVKDGTQFSMNLYISTSDHPVVPVFTQMKTDIEKMGGLCDIVTLEWAVYTDKYSAGELEVWAAAWQATPDPDMYQVYHSSAIAKGQNPYCINNAELDRLIEDGIKTTDKEKRKEIYSKALDVVMEEAVEMPFYQRKNMYVMNPNNVDITSLPENMTPYYEWDAEIYKLKTVTAESK